MRGAIRGHQRPLEVIRGHQRPSEAIRGHAWAIRGIRGHQRPSEAAVPFDVAPRDWLGDPAVGVVTEHLARVIRAIRAIRAIRVIRVIRVNSGKFGKLGWHTPGEGTSSSYRVRVCQWTLRAYRPESGLELRSRRLTRRAPSRRTAPPRAGRARG